MSTKVSDPRFLNYFSSQGSVKTAGYGDTSTKIWKLYGTESEKHDKALVNSWMGNTDSMLIFVRSNSYSLLSNHNVLL